MMLSEDGLKVLFEKILKLRQDESFLMLTDGPNDMAAKEVSEFAKRYTEDVRHFVMEELTENGQEPAEDVSGMMLEAKTQMYWTTRSLSHTNARKRASEKGARIISSPGLTPEMFNRTVGIEYDEMLRLNRILTQEMKVAGKIKITTDIGTDVEVSVHSTFGKGSLALGPGDFDNLPFGEACGGIDRKVTNGKVMFDGSFPGLGILKEPIEVTITDGVGKIVGEHGQANELKERLESVGPDAFKMAELGIGTNPCAILTGAVLEDEKVLGTAHMAFGSDISFGGNNNVPLHLDGIIKSPTIMFDDKKIMEDGRFVI